MPTELLRINRDTMLMGVAQLVAQRGTCLRLQVGALVALDGRIISTGYNGAPAGMEHCNVSNCSWDKPCERTIHAEANAIVFAARHGVKLDGSTLYTTYSPCKTCAGLIINAGVKLVVYKKAYRDSEPLDILTSAEVGHYIFLP